MFPRLCVCIIAIIVSTLVYAVTVTEAHDDSAASTSSVLQRRKTNYLNFAGKTYYFGTIFKANFFQALQFCRQQDMQLVAIHSQAENERLGRFAREIGSEVTFGRPEQTWVIRINGCGCLREIIWSIPTGREGNPAERVRKDSKKIVWR